LSALVAGYRKALLNLPALRRKQAAEPNPLPVLPPLKAEGLAVGVLKHDAHGLG